MKAARRGKILLVDDDRFYLKVISDAFTDAGFEVVTAEDGQQGVDAFAAGSPFDAVLLDLVMPRMGGVSASLQIARLSEEDPLIILLTSMFQGAPHEHPVPEMGAKVHIPKSTSPLDIVIIVEQILERRRRGSAA